MSTTLEEMSTPTSAFQRLAQVYADRAKDRAKKPANPEYMEDGYPYSEGPQTGSLKVGQMSINGQVADDDIVNVTPPAEPTKPVMMTVGDQWVQDWGQW